MWLHGYNTTKGCKTKCKNKCVKLTHSQTMVVPQEIKTRTPDDNKKALITLEPYVSHCYNRNDTGNAPTEDYFHPLITNCNAMNATKTQTWYICSRWQAENSSCLKACRVSWRFEMSEAVVSWDNMWNFCSFPTVRPLIIPALIPHTTWTQGQMP